MSRFICSEEHPRPKDAVGQWEHTRVKEVGEQENGFPGGDIVTLKCLNCGLEWKQELPQ